jgi:hypothetical protein
MTPTESPVSHASRVLCGQPAVCPWPPTQLQREALRILLFHQGAQRPISLRDLMGKLDRVTSELPTERETKDAIRGLVVDFKVRIGASRSRPFGYYLITTTQEARDSARPYINEIRELAARVRVLLDPHDLAELAGQQWLELLTKEPERVTPKPARDPEEAA